MKLLDALKDVTSADLAQINARLEAINAEIEALERNSAAEVKGLKALRILIEAKLGLAPPKKTWSRKKKPPANSAASEAHPDDSRSEDDAGVTTRITVTELHRGKAREFLRSRIAESVSAISKQCGIPQGSINNVLKHDWFIYTARGVELTTAGKRAE